MNRIQSLYRYALILLTPVSLLAQQAGAQDKPIVFNYQAPIYPGVKYQYLQLLKKPDGSMVCRAVAENGEISEKPLTDEEFEWIRQFFDGQTPPQPDLPPEPKNEPGKLKKFGFSLAFAANGASGPALSLDDRTLDLTVTDSTATEEITAVPMSLGEGFSFHAGVGYQIHPHIKLAVDASYLKTTSFGSNEIAIHELGIDEFRESFRGEIVRFAPAIEMSPRPSRWTPYLRAGLVLAFPFFTRAEDVLAGNGTLTHLEEDFEGGGELGFYGAVGMSYTFLNEHLSLFGAMQWHHINYHPVRSEVKIFTVDGEDRLETLSTRERITEYTDHYQKTYTQNDNGELEEIVDPDVPRQRGVFGVSFGSVGLKIGVRVRL